MDKDERIRQRAYELWYGQGCPHGRDQEHWEQAMREVEEAEERAKRKAQDTEETVALGALTRT